MSIRQTLALLAGLAALKALPAAGEEYRTLARLTDLFKRDPSRAAALVATAREGSRAINPGSDAQRSPNLPGGSDLRSAAAAVERSTEASYGTSTTSISGRTGEILGSTPPNATPNATARRPTNSPAPGARARRPGRGPQSTTRRAPDGRDPPNPASRVLSKSFPRAAFVRADRQTRPSTSGPSRSLARVAWRFAKVHTGSRTERRSPGTRAAAEPGRNFTTKWPCGWDHISPHNRHAVGSRRRSSCSS